MKTEGPKFWQPNDKGSKRRSKKQNPVVRPSYNPPFVSKKTTVVSTSVTDEKTPSVSAEPHSKYVNPYKWADDFNTRTKAIEVRQPTKTQNTEAKAAIPGDSRAHMSESERIEEFTETGNFSYLTPALARKLGFAVDENGVISLSTEDEDTFRHNELLKLGIDTGALRNTSPESALVQLIPLAATRQSSHDDDGVENRKYIAEGEILALIREHPEKYVHALFRLIDLRHTAGLQTIALVDHLTHLIKDHVTQLQEDQQNPHLPKAPYYRNLLKSLDYIMSSAEELKGRSSSEPGALYFVSARAQVLADEILALEPVKQDVDQVIPFELIKGTYALFSGDKNRIYVASRSVSKNVAQAIRTGWTSEFVTRGHDIPSYDYEFVPEAVIDLLDDVLDSGTPIDQYLASIPALSEKLTQDMVDEYVLMLDSRMRKIIETDLNIRLRDLSIPEQLYFLEYAKTTSLGSFAQLSVFVQIYESLGLRTFLALEHFDKNFGADIIEYGNWKDALGNRDHADEVFHRFGKLQDKVNEVKEFLVGHFHKSADKKLIFDVQEYVRKRAAQFLDDVLSHGPSWESFGKTIELLKKADEEVVLFTSATKLLQKRGELSLEEIQGVSLEQYEGQTISEKDRAEMLRIHAERYREKYPADLYETLHGQLTKALSDDSSRFYLLRRKGEIVTYVRFDSAEEHKKGAHVASFMTESRFAGGNLGEALFEVALQRELAQGKTIYGECDPPLASLYERHGFKVVRKYVDAHGVPTSDIELAPPSSSSAAV